MRSPRSAELALACFLVAGATSADESMAAKRGALVRVYLTPEQAPGDVHAVYGDGRDVIVARKLGALPKLAPDGATLAYLSCVEHSHGRSPDYQGGALVVYRNGRRVRTVEGEPFVRDYQFWNGGREVAIEFGAHHGPGWYHLVDVDSGKRLASVQSSDLYRDGKLVGVVPDWVAALLR